MQYELSLDGFSITFDEPLPFTPKKGEHLTVYLGDRILFNGFVVSFNNYGFTLMDYFNFKEYHKAATALIPKTSTLT